MSPFTPLDSFDDIDTYDVSDLVLGGTTGTSNLPIEALANRTQYLYNRLGCFEDVKALTAGYVYDVADDRKVFAFTYSDNISFILPDVSTVRKGKIIAITASTSLIKALTIQCSGAQQIYDGSVQSGAMYMHDGEVLLLVAATDHWIAFPIDGNFRTAGESKGVRLQPRNSYIAQGTVVNRADTPRLTAVMIELINTGGTVTDSVWLSNPGGNPVYRGCFSSGDGVATMRLPDERGMHDRYLDLSRGIDLSRLYSGAGGYGKDGVGIHNHGLTNGNQTDGAVAHIQPGSTNQGISGGGNNGGSFVITKTDNAGATETTVKTIGKIPVILY